MPRQNPEPPEWWNRGLYSFLKELSLEGWIWEFFRRARLLQLLGHVPVDAINPKPDFHRLTDELGEYLYMPLPELIERLIWSGKQPLYFVPSARLLEKFPSTFHGQPLHLSRYASNSGKITEVLIDLDRRDTAIKRDFDELLKQMRKKIKKQPKRLNPRQHHWVDSRLLEVWDLRQYGVTFEDIANILEIHAPPILKVSITYERDRTRNAYRSATNYINKGKWESLARYTEI